MHKYFYKINVLNIFEHASYKCFRETFIKHKGKWYAFKYESKPPVDGSKWLF